MNRIATHGFRRHFCQRAPRPNGREEIVWKTYAVLGISHCVVVFGSAQKQCIKEDKNCIPCKTVCILSSAMVAVVWGMIWPFCDIGYLNHYCMQETITGSSSKNKE
jgi:hypothetical protein